MKRQIPASWAWATLNQIAARVPYAIVDGPFGSNLKLTDYVETDGIPVLQGKNLTGNELRWFDIRFISRTKAEELKRSSVRIGDILMVKIGSIGYSAVVNDLNGYNVAIIPANLVKISVDSTKAQTSYVHHWLKSDGVKRYLLQHASKTAQPALSLQKVKELRIPLPPLPEQQRIAAILDQAEALHTKRRQALAKLDTLTQSLFLEMFGDPALNPRGLELLRLGDLASKFSDGPFGSNLKSEHYKSEGVRVVRLQNIGVNEFLDADKAFISEAHASLLKKHECLPGDVLVGTLGEPNLRSCVQPCGLARAINKADCVQIRANRNVTTPMFISALLNMPSVEKMANGMIYGQTRSRIAMGRLRELAVPVPPLNEQLRFSAIISTLDQRKAVFAAATMRVRKFQSSLQQRAFRGEL